LGIAIKSRDRIDALLDTHTFTVCTAHQPCLFTGPAFVLSKAISTIKLAQLIQEALPAYRILPVFVIGAEDHDLEELNHCFLFGKKITWETRQSGPLGRFDLEGIEACISEAESLLVHTPFGPELIRLLREAHAGGRSFAGAFQYLMHALLGEHGLLVINLDDRRLKEEFKPWILDEVLHSSSKPLVTGTQARLMQLGYEASTHVRDINFFYFDKGYRDRIERENGSFLISNQGLKLDEKSMAAEIEQHPEKFSPNVILRPLYQELILPNLAFVGGGGELAYWMERKSQFEALGVPYPALVRRDSFLVIQPEQKNLLDQFGLNVADLAERTDLLMNRMTEKLSSHELSLQEEILGITAWMDKIKARAESVDPTLGPSIEAEKVKMAKSIEHLEKKILKAEKSKLEVKLNKIRKLKEKLLPENGLQERRENFMTFYSEHGPAFIRTLVHDFNPLDRQFKLIQIEG
jgi:bacillithiol biosynthesis cysteine-adding enzyme BshC